MQMEKEAEAVAVEKRQWVYPVEVYLRGVSDHKNNTDVDVMRESTILYIEKCRVSLLEQLEKAYKDFLSGNGVPVKRRPKGAPANLAQFSWQPELLAEFLREYPPTSHLEAIIYPVMGSDREEYSIATILSPNAIDSYKVPDCNGVLIDFIIE